MNTNKKHKHYDCIVAWAEGKEIQCYINSTEGWAGCSQPSWAESIEYRIKPEKKVIRFRNYLYNIEYGQFSIQSRISDEFCPETFNGFVKWIGDWQEVEVDDL